MRMAAALERWWFAPSARYQLGVFRVLLVGWVAYHHATRVFPRLAEFAARPREFLDRTSLARAFELAGLPVPPPPGWTGALELSTWLLVLCALLGIGTRAALIALAFSNLYLGAAVNSWGYTPHAAALPALALVVLAAAPGAASFSVDVWLAKRRGRAAAPFPSVWPVRLMLVLLCTVYFASGIAKLRHAGWQWTDGKTLEFYLSGGSRLGAGERQRFIADRDAPAEVKWRDPRGLVDFAYLSRPTPLARAVVETPGAPRALSLVSLLFELGFPLVLLGRRVLNAFLVFGVLFHLGIILTLRIEFWSYLVVYTMFVDFRGLGDLVRRRSAAIAQGMRPR